MQDSHSIQHSLAIAAITCKLDASAAGKSIANVATATNDGSAASTVTVADPGKDPGKDPANPLVPAPRGQATPLSALAPKTGDVLSWTSFAVTALASLLFLALPRRTRDEKPDNPDVLWDL